MEQIFIVPDRFLGTLPFETLMAEDGKYLIEKHAFVYLGDATALVRFGERSRLAEASLLVAGAIDYRGRDEDNLGFG